MATNMKEAIETAEQDEWLREHPPEIQWLSFRCEPYYQDPAHPFVQTVLSAVKEIVGKDIEVKPRGNTWSEDTRYAQYFGFPAVSFGPRGKNAHGLDEYVALDSLILTTKALAYTTLKWCSQDKE
ncbi:MAG: M20/M25/M40 family metallo-hydrolase [Deltaproteobacteria bacterium]|nr:M20/M25/M40 family metallo-hydrolase [Deltaproteobacteria bacterium]MBW2153386.1 M20/M25/M40 family metallo-hydrolase [Deltaproteobacteria bacterium]